MYRIKQLKTAHWIVIMLAVINIAIMLPNSSQKAGVVPQHLIIYPPNLVSIILINSDEYRALAASAKIKEKKEVMMCYELGPFIEKEYVSAVKHHLASRKIDVFRKTDTEKQKIGYWVYLEPERSRALGRLKVEEVKLMGLSDVALLTHNNPRYSISLGFFKGKSFANRRLLKAQSLGLAAKMDVRYKYQDYQWLIVKTTNKKDLSQNEWLNILQSYENIELKTVNCQ